MINERQCSNSHGHYFCASHIHRIAGAYYDAEGYIDGTFNTHFFKTFHSRKTKNLELAKAKFTAETNKQLNITGFRKPQEKTGKYPGRAFSGWESKSPVC